MKIITRTAAALASLTALAACMDDMPDSTPQANLRAEESACLRDVAALTGNPQVVLLGSTVEGMGMEITVGVGPQRAPWRCVGYPDGTTSGITSLTDEGAL